MKEKMFGKSKMILVLVILLSSMILVPYAAAQPLTKKIQEKEKLIAVLEEKLSEKISIIEEKVSKLLNENQRQYAEQKTNDIIGTCEIHPMLRDIILIMYEFIAMVIGHNMASFGIVFLLTIWWVAPIIMIQDIGGFGIDFSRFQEIVQQELAGCTFEELYYQFGIFAIFFFGYELCRAYLVAFLECMGTGGTEGGWWERVVQDLQDTYNTDGIEFD